MRARLWRLKEGPEWEQSLLEADPHDAYFEDSLSTARLALELDPRACSHPLVEEHDDVRVFTTKDRAAGYRVVIGIYLDFPVVTLGWVEIESLEEGL